MRRHHTRHGSQEDTITREDGQENGGGVDQSPGIDDWAEEGDDVRATPDVDKSREHGSEIHAAGQGITGEVAADLGDGKGETCEEDGGAGAWALAFLKQAHKERGRVPDGLAIHALLRGGCDEDTDDGGGDAVERKSQRLAPNGISWPPRQTSVIVLVENTRRDGPDGRHDAVRHQPGGAVRAAGGWQRAIAVEGAAKPIWSHGRQSPDEEHEEEGQSDDTGNVKELFDAVGLDPQHGQTSDAEDQVAQELGAGGTCSFWNVVGNVVCILGIP